MGRRQSFLLSRSVWVPPLVVFCEAPRCAAAMEMNMKRSVRFAVSVAALFFGSAALAQQATDQKMININADVKPMINITVNTPTMTWSVTTPGAGPNNTGNLGTTPGVHRALFTVTSNTNYNLVVTNSTGCWQATDLDLGTWTNFQQVKFESNTGHWMGSNIDLDRDPGSTGVTYEWNNIDRSVSPPVFTGDCNIVSESYPAETHQWALAAQFNPRINGNAANPAGIPNSLAPPGIYSTTAIITASTMP